MLVPEGADRIRFKLNVVNPTGDSDVLQVFMNGVLLDTRPAGTPAVDIGQITSGFEERVLFIPDSIRQLATNQHGTVATLSFKLLDPIQGRNVDSVIYIDDIRLSNAGQPLQVESVAAEADVMQMVTQNGLHSVIEAAQLGWIGLIDTPNWSGWVTLGSVGIPTTELSSVQVSNFQKDGNTGISEGGFDNQRLFTDFKGSFNLPVISHESARDFWIGSIGSRLSYGTLVTDQIGSDNDAPLSADSHPIQSQDDSLLLQRQHAILGDVIVNEDIPLHSEIADGGAAINGLAIPISIADFNFRRNFAAQGSEGAIVDLEILDLEELSLRSLEALSPFGGKFNGFVTSTLFAEVTTGLRNSENQQNQSAFQHGLSFGNLTVPPDRDGVNNSEAISSQPSAISSEQLALLSQATITIADLPDGYLALTLGTTITLDTDAAGYGWFIDQTPLTHEEFVSGSSPWQFTALDGSAASGKIDLMTVLMHELGHVMGLGHVSSVMDGTRLMAGSIDPGIRRLPSALDLGEPSHQHSAVSDQPSDSHLWDPYLAHYTTTSDATPTTPLTPINPARLVQAAQLPTHSGIFNSNFAISDQADAQFGWDESGAVTIANGQAVLSENSNVISTLSQLFTLPAGSTHLRFTLVDVNLQTNGANRPSDAFEVAFLEASTLTPLAGVTAGLTQTDSLFNLQQDGTVRFSNRVTLSTGTLSGSTLDLTQPVIVDIDLTGITVGAGARLSFDLLGFGDRTSTIVLDNVLLTDGAPTAAPMAVDDSYTIAEGATVNVPTLGLLTNDSDPDSPTFSLTPPTHGTLTLNADGSFTYIHNGSETTTDSFTYRVSDGINFSNLATVSLTITPTNDAPVIAAIPAQSVEQGRTLTVQVVATDPDDSNISPESSALTFSLQPNTLTGISIDPTSGVLTWAVLRTQTVGLYTIAVNVTDAGTPALSATRSVAVDVLELSNTAPTLDPIGPKTVNEEAELRFTISATDLDLPAQILTYSATGLPTGATFDPTTREFFWTPAEDQGGTSYQVTFAVTDGEFSASELVTVTVNEINVAPVLAPIGARSVNEEAELRFTISATDADLPAQSLIYSATGLPAGATFDAITREFVWTPTEAQGPGSYVVTFSVTDGVVTTSEAVTITVGEVNVAPVLAPIGAKTVNEETELRFTINGSDVDVPTQTLVYSVTGVPTGALFNAATREFVWTPTEAQGPGSYVVTFSVTDGVVTTSEVVTITVGEVNVAPVLAPIGAKAINEETELRFTISASDVDDPTQTLVYSATGLPTGASFDPTTREFSWTPTEAQGPGSYDVTFSVSDGVVTTSELVTITVGEVNVAPVLALILRGDVHPDRPHGCGP